MIADFARRHARSLLALAILVALLGGGVMAQLQQSGGAGSTVMANQGGTWTVQPGNTANTTAWKVDGIGGTFPISGSIGNTGFSVTGSLPAGSAVIGKVGIDQTTPGTTNAISLAQVGTTATATGNGVVNAGVQRVAIASDNTAFVVNTVPKTSCGNTLATGSQLAAVPTSSTLVTSAATACVVAIIMNNTTGAALTVTVTDNTGTPINDILTFSIPPNSQLIQPLYGTAFNLGVKWLAGGAGVTGAVVAYQ
jgi:hypothetical protein